MISEDIRYELTIFSFPNDLIVPRACEIIYQLQDTNLIAAMHVTPYQVGRSFNKIEQERLASELRSESIGYRFKAIPPHSEEIIFDPKSPSNSPPVAETSKPASSSISQDLGRSKKSPLVLVFTLIGVVSLSWIASRYFLSISSTDSNSPIEKSMPIGLDQAQIESLSQRVETRSRNSLRWHAARPGQVLEEGDSIRTYEKASAKIKYPDGNFVVVRENSLLLIGPSYENLKTQLINREVELKDGRLRAWLKNSKTTDSWIIKTAGGNLRITPEVSSSTTEVLTLVSNGDFQFQVTEGSASFQSSDQDTTSMLIKKNQQIVSTKEGGFQVEAFKPEIRLLSPRSSETLFLKTETSNRFLFEWEAPREALEYQWRIYLDAKKENLILSRKTESESVEISYLDPGEIYWQVTSQMEGIEISSPLEKFYVEISNN